jgi:hypothetical protein
VEDELMKPKSVEALLKCFVSAKANSFENLLDPLLKISRLSTNLTIAIAKAQFFKRIIDRLGHSKAVVRLNLLRILRAVCDVHPNRAILVERYGLHEIVLQLSRNDGAVLVRELAREILPALVPVLKPMAAKYAARGLSSGGVGEGIKGGNVSLAPRKARRTASETGVSASGASATSSALGLQGPSKLSRFKLGDISWQSANRR